jgi:hypothetical protein
MQKITLKKTRIRKAKAKEIVINNMVITNNNEPSINDRIFYLKK